MKIKLEETVLIKNLSSDFSLEYYLMEDNNKKYGLKIDKKENKNGKEVLMEEYIPKYFSKDKGKIDNVLKLLSKNRVTPITADNILNDLGYFD